MANGDQANPYRRTVNHVTVSSEGLSRVGARPSPLAYIRDIWKFRHFILFDSRSRIAGQASTDILGRFWLVLNPILNGMTYFFVFGILLGTSRGIENFIGYLIIGVFMFRYTSASIMTGARSIIGNQNVIQAFNFPRATLPIAANVRESLSHVVTLITMFILILVIPPVEAITWKWLLFLPLVLIQFLFNLGLSLLLARLVTLWQDLVHVIGFFTRIWMYLSAVFYSVERFADNPEILLAMNINPMFAVLDIARNLLLYDTWPSASSWIVLLIWTLAALIIGFFVFWKAEETYGQEQ